MKLKIAIIVATVFLTALTACEAGAPASDSTSSASTKPSPTPSPTRTAIAVPDVTGRQASAASGTLTNLGFRTVYVDKNGTKWANVLPNKDVTIVGTDPAAGTLTKAQTVDLITSISAAEQAAAEKAAADAANLAIRYEFNCGSVYSGAPGDGVYHSYKEVWASKYHGGSGNCMVTIDGKYASDKPPLLPSEQAIVDIVAANGGEVSIPAYSFTSVLGLCANVKPGYADEVNAKPERKKSEAKAALTICPDAPHAAILQEVVDTVKIGDGNKVVGKDMEPGTYRTKPSITDCYWSRNTGGGDIIANDFVGFAPEGVTVTVYIGEGFESSRCGVWTKIG